MNEKIETSLTIREQVANIIRGRIFGGELASGMMLSERAISTELEVSTTPIKEAFRMLSAEGLLITLPRRGVQVSDIRENMMYLSFIRSSLEGLAGYFAARNRTDKQIEQLEEALEGARNCLQKEDIEGIQKNNNIIHDVIREASESVYLINLLKNFSEIDKCMRVKAAKHGYKERLKDFEDHKNIIEAIKMRNSERAEELMVHHIRKGYIRIMDY